MIEDVDEQADALRRLDDPPLLLLAGAGEPPPGLEARSLGPLDDDALLADAYRAADVYAVPTLADVLTQTGPEALACGTPCVAFDRGGVTDVVLDGETGLHAAFGDPGSLAAALRTLLGDAELRARLGRRGRELAEAEFSRRVQRKIDDSMIHERSAVVHANFNALAVREVRHLEPRVEGKRAMCRGEHLHVIGFTRCSAPSVVRIAVPTCDSLLGRTDASGPNTSTRGCSRNICVCACRAA